MRAADGFQLHCAVMLPPLISRGIKRWFCLTSDVCLTSFAYIWPKSRTGRPRKTKIGTEVAHVTHDSDITFKGKVTARFTHRGVNASGSCSGERGNVLTVGTYCYVGGQHCRRGRLGSARRFGAHRGRRGAGAYCGGRPPTVYFLCISDLQL